MNNPFADRRAAIIECLNAIFDPVSGQGLHEAGRIAGLTVTEGGKISFAIEAPPDRLEAYRKVRDRAEAALLSLPGAGQITAVLTTHDQGGSDIGVSQVGAIIAVASAKGGVGKSSVAVNLACAFAAQGKTVGLLDLDVYGPSAPTMLGLAGAKPVMRPGGTLEPLDAHGLKAMSVGFLVEPDTAMIWRGPMATGAIRQMLDQVAWGPLDVLVLDLPPGTGDIQLTLLQRLQLAGAIIVSTPQELALADVRRGLAMFEKAHAPILGIVENMAYFEAPSGQRTYIFGEGGARRTAEQSGAPFLGEIALDQSFRESGDSGLPYLLSHPDTPISNSFKAIAQAALDNAAQFKKPAPSIRLV